ncbi:LacI family DNA-binding transcriptional regulator [Paenibacillus sp. GCM10023248]|uniref:LacI family DNA-binding transcriptional regulator n=1 Tax=Bacillales TaxID=1385 RepID=UPI002379E954|nr:MULTISPECIES: LacI family DNA-binding transcriptional regulator [Bacillales]MDD9271344.1 LacI family DNA-binding transcriptional regulator [Paenibacillus sp. MAHUQ-63]MDR6881533.1 LacI family transcriptional regulator [Bacillus sp. 3255]
MNKNKQPTIIDVASEAGVSIATVSNVINRRKVPMAPETIRKVEEAVARLGYRRNVMATNLSRRRSYELGLIIPHFGGYYGRFAEQLEQKVHQYGYHLSVFSAAGMDPEIEQRHLEHLLQRRVDGLVSHGLAMSMHSTQQLVGEGTPLVIFNGWGWPSDIVKLAVNLDFAKASSEAVRHFLDKGCRSVIYAGRRMGMGANEQRIQGFLGGLGEREDEVVHALLDAGELGVAGILDEALRLSGDRRPIGIYTFNDAMALEILAVCHERGIRVPEDVQLIGMDNELYSKASFPSITSFEMPVDLQTSLVAAFLMRDIGEELDETNSQLLDAYLPHVAGHELLIDLEMIVRKSTGQ